MNVDRLYPVVALVLLAAATIWLERATRTPESAARIDRSDPDFIGEHVRIASFDTDGRLAYELDADRMTHYPNSDITDFERPDLRYRSETGVTTAQAARGESHPDADLIALQGEVVVVRRDNEGEESIIESDSLSVWPDAQRVATDSPVVVKNGNITAHGEGMRADDLAGTFELVGPTRVQMPSSRRTRQ